MTEKVAVVGTTSWGTTLALLLLGKGLQVRLLARTAAEARELSRRGENPLLPDIPLPRELSITADVEEALKGAALVIMAVPSQTMRQNLRWVAPALDRRSLILSAAKGLELGSCKRMVEVVQEELGGDRGAFCVLSGPNFAREIAQGQPTSSVVACRDPEVARRVQALLMTPRFRVYTNDDVVGVEMGAPSRTSSPSGPAWPTAWATGPMPRPPSSPGAWPRSPAWGWPVGPAP